MRRVTVVTYSTIWISKRCWRCTSRTKRTTRSTTTATRSPRATSSMTHESSRPSGTSRGRSKSPCANHSLALRPSPSCTRPNLKSHWPSNRLPASSSNRTASRCCRWTCSPRAASHPRRATWTKPEAEQLFQALVQLPRPRPEKQEPAFSLRTPPVDLLIYSSKIIILKDSQLTKEGNLRSRMKNLNNYRWKKD